MSETKQAYYHVGYYVVCIIDILGQQARLTDWSTLPSGGRPSPKFIAALQSTSGSVLRIKEAFADYFSSFDQRPEPPVTLNDEQKAVLARWRACELRTQQFSDTFVFYSPMMNAHGDFGIEGIYRILSACSMVMMVSLGGKVSLRGGVCIGTAMELEPGNLYGHGLARAHHLESKVAKYPRIVVAKELVDFLRAGGGFSGHPKIDELNGVFAQTCRRFLTKDDDGEMIVDFLGEGYQESIGGNSESKYRAVIQAGYDFVCDEEARFAQEKNAELRARYGRLRRYLESRLNLWGVSPRKQN